MAPKAPTLSVPPCPPQKVNDEQARITLTLPASCEEEDAVQAVLTGMMLTLSALRDDYPDYIEVMEV